MIRRQHSKSPPTPPAISSPSSRRVLTNNQRDPHDSRVDPIHRDPQTAALPNGMSGCVNMNINIIININLYIYFAQMFTGTFNDPTLIRVVIRWLHAGEQPAQQLSRQIENVQMSVCAPTRETLASRCVCSRGAFNQPPRGGVKLFSLSEREEHLSRSLRARLARPASQFVRPHCLSKGQFTRYQTVIITFMYGDHLQGAWAEVSHPGCSDGAKKTKCPVQSSWIYYYQP